MLLPSEDYRQLCNALKTVRVKNLTEYLHSLHWKNFRSSMISKAACCAACKKRRWLHLHHKQYASLGKETEKDVVWLCWYCHELVHKTAFTNGVSIHEATTTVIDGMSKELPIHIPKKLNIHEKAIAQIQREAVMNQNNKNKRKKRKRKTRKHRRFAG